MMSRIMVRALRLPLKRKILFIRVSLILLAVRLGLSVFSFSKVYRFLKRFHSPDKPVTFQNPALTDVDNICWAVTHAGKLWFGDEGCLPQAIVGELLLLGLGIPVQMQIGIRNDQFGRLQAHAWVQGYARIFIGENSSLSRNEYENFPEIQRIVQQQESNT